MYQSERKSALSSSSRPSSRSPLQELKSNSHHNGHSRKKTHSPEMGELTAPGETKTKTQMARAFKEEQELYKAADCKAGLQTVINRRVLKKTTTITRGENEKTERDNSAFREKLLRWAQRTCDGYPGTRVVDLTTSWRDGLAYNAIIHRNRPDLLNYRACQKKTSFENLDQAFTVGQRDLGIERLLEPADVDRPDQDEKEMITYLAQLYKLFPDPPERNPLLDEEMIRRIEEYKDLASRLLNWIKTSTSKLEDRRFPKTIPELKKLKDDNERFLTDEVPPKHHDKERLAAVAREIFKMAQEVNYRIDKDLHIDNIDYHWNRMMNAHKARSKALDDEIARAERLKALLDKLLNEINKANGKLDVIEGDIDEEERRIARISSLKDATPGKIEKLGEDLARVGKDIDNIKKMANDFIQEAGKNSPDSVMVREKVNELDTRYKRLLAKLNNLHEQFEKTLRRLRDMEDADRRAAAQREAEAKLRLKLDEMKRRLDELERRIDNMEPPSKDPATLQRQLAELQDFGRDLNRAKVDLNDLCKLAEDMIRDDLIVDPPRLRMDLQALKDQLARIEDKAARRLREFDDALKHAERQKKAEAEIKLKLDGIRKQLEEMERRIDNMGPVGKDLATVQRQIEEMNVFNKDLDQVRRNLNDVIRLAEDMIRDDLITDPTSLRANIRGLKDHLARIDEKAARRMKALQDALRRAEAQKEAEAKFNLLLDGMKRELDELERKLDNMGPIGKDIATLQKQLSEMNDFGRQLDATRVKLNDLLKAGEDLIRDDMIADPTKLRANMKALKDQFARIEDKAAKRLRDIKDAMSRVAVSDRIQEVAQWLNRAKKVLLDEENVFGDLDTVNALIEQHKSFQDELANRQPVMNEIRRMEQELSNSSPQNGAIVRDELSALSNQWRDVERLMREKSAKLDEALVVADKMQGLVHNVLAWYSGAENKLKSGDPLPLDEISAKQQLAEHEKFVQRLGSSVPDRDQANKMIKDILAKCHLDAEPIIKQWLSVMQARHEDIEAMAKAKGIQLTKHVGSLMELLKLVGEMIDWLAHNEARLLSEEADPLPANASQLESMIKQNSQFIEELRRREPNVDKVVKVFAANSDTATSKVIVTATTTKPRSDSKTAPTFSSSGRLSAGGSRSGTPTRTSYATYKDEYPDVNQGQAKLMLDKWRTVWQLALDKEQRLRDGSEMERMENFDLDQWRRRFVSWINSGKGHMMDFFRSLDDNNDGQIPVDAFISGVMRSKFETSRAEMERVAEAFDKNNDGKIDNKEYLETLRPEKPMTDEELIEDEVQRQVAKCSSKQDYKVYHVGDGRYRFGESQKLRLVRVSHNTVMVQVGGTWEPLSTFIQKNNPCQDS